MASTARIHIRVNTELRHLVLIISFFLIMGNCRFPDDKCYLEGPERKSKETQTFVHICTNMREHA